MLPSPQTSPSIPRIPLDDRTNDPFESSPIHPLPGPSSLPTPHDTPSLKRSRRSVDQKNDPNKRLCATGSKSTIYDTDTSDEDIDGLVSNQLTHTQMCASSVQGRLRGLASGNPRIRRNFTLPSYPILKSFTSSNEQDVYKCRSMDQGSYLTPPYACAFSHDAKLGKSSVLAVATEQGSIEVIDTRKRSEDDPEPSRTTLQIHNNGIFDIKWSPMDTHLVTCSGDRTARIVDPRANVPEALHILQGHSSTVKCAAWNPSHQYLLATGGRDGNIHVWDLRVGTNMEVDEGEQGPNHLSPVMTIPYTHEAFAGKPTRPKRGVIAAAKSVTSIVYTGEHEIVSSGSNDGILRKWDLRQASSPPTPKPKARGKRNANILADEASFDLTTSRTTPSIYDPPRSPASAFLSSSPLQRRSSSIADLYSPRRARGISTVVLGCGPSAGRLFALGIDSRVHVYNPYGASGVPLSNEMDEEDGVLPSQTFSHPNMVTNSFYVRISLSPCGRWLASGGTGGSAFLFDISQSDPLRSGRACVTPGVQLPGQRGEVGALDWANESLATCADDGTVRIWRPDSDIVGQCWESEALGMCVARMSRTRITSGVLRMGEMRTKWCWANMDAEDST